MRFIVKRCDVCKLEKTFMKFRLSQWRADGPVCLMCSTNEKVVFKSREFKVNACLRCDAKFRTQSNYRLCPDCKRSTDWGDGNDA